MFLMRKSTLNFSVLPLFYDYSLLSTLFAPCKALPNGFFLVLSHTLQQITAKEYEYIQLERRPHMA